MKIIMTSTMALGALGIVALNQPAKAEISTNDPNFHLTRGGGHGGGGHMGGGHMGGGGHAWGGHGGHGWHGDGWGGYGGWGAFGAGVAAGAVGSAVLDDGRTTVYQNTYSSYPVYDTAPLYDEGYTDYDYNDDAY